MDIHFHIPAIMLWCAGCFMAGVVLGAGAMYIYISNLVHEGIGRAFGWW